MVSLYILGVLFAAVSSLPEKDFVTPIGFTDEVIYSGYLETETTGRSLHYVFIKSKAEFESSPLAIWLNGGPGCSSLIGMLQEIGPYWIGNSYKQGDSLTRNNYTWNKAAHLLFIESPAIVGFSTDKDPDFPYTDSQTANDAFHALKDFLMNKAAELRENELYITGESYAGKYIPDLAVRISTYNKVSPETQKINLKGLLIGNGVMDFSEFSLDKSEIQYMYEHDFIDERLWSIYQRSCLTDFTSPRCKYFQLELERYDEASLNPYFVYEVCKAGKSSEALRLIRSLSKINSQKLHKDFTSQETASQFGLQLGEIQECPSDQGAIDYWNANIHAYHVNDVNKTWAPCSKLNYTIGDRGSMEEYLALFQAKEVRIWLYNGDWDDVVPYRDTQKNLEKLRASKVGNWKPWFHNKHHAGFYQEYDKVQVITVKGASHMVPQTKPAQAYQLFYNFLKNLPINTDVEAQS